MSSDRNRGPSDRRPRTRGGDDPRRPRTPHEPGSAPRAVIAPATSRAVFAPSAPRAGTTPAGPQSVIRPAAPGESRGVSGARLFDLSAKAVWIVVTTSRGLEAAILDEIEELREDLGLEFASDPQPMAAGVRLQAGWDACVALNAGLSTASRVLVPLASGLVRDLDGVYALARKITWADIFDPDRTIAVGATVSSGPVNNNMQVALKVKDAIADAFRDACGRRPDVDTDRPDVRIAVRMLGPELEISLNTSGEALTHHGYRGESGEAPLRESLAAGLLRYAGFAAFARNLPSDEVAHYTRPGAEDGEGEGKARRMPARIPWYPVVVDPMCGTGTFLIEAAFLLLRRKPCARRGHFAFLELKRGASLARILARVQEKLLALERSVTEVHTLVHAYRAQVGLAWEAGDPFLLGYDTDPAALQSARANAVSAGVSKLVAFEKRDATRAAPPASEGGLCIVNPPYGERLGRGESLPELYKALGDQWKREYRGWMCWMLSGNADAAKAVGLRPTRKVAVFNGNLPCSFQQYVMY